MAMTLLSFLGTLTQEAAADCGRFQRREWKFEKAHWTPIHTESIGNCAEKLKCVSLDTVKPRRRRSVSESPQVLHEMALGPPPLQHVQTFVTEQEKMPCSSLQPPGCGSAFLQELFGELRHGCFHVRGAYKVFASNDQPTSHNVPKSETFIC